MNEQIGMLQLKWSSIPLVLASGISEDHEVKELFGIRKISNSLRDFLWKEVMEDVRMSIVEASECIEMEQSSGAARRKHIETLIAAVDRGSRGDVWKASDFIQYHAMMFPYGGMLRKSEAFASGSYHTYISPRKIWNELDRFADDLDCNVYRLTANKGWKLYQPVSEAHFRICNIHPFDDGNGRLARVFSNWHSVFLGLPTVKLGPERDVYIQLLEDEDIDGLASLMWDSRTAWYG
jgi:hypothetical protein